MNGEQLGDINHSRIFAKNLDDAIFETMKSDMSSHMNMKLDATKHKRPVGMVFDKTLQTTSIKATFRPPSNTLPSYP